MDNGPMAEGNLSFLRNSKQVTVVTRVKKAQQTVLLDEGRNEAQRMLRTWVFIERELETG